MRVRREVITGALFAAIGSVFLTLSHNYAMGSVGRMGPGWFPAALATLLLLLGVGMVIKGLVAGSSEEVTLSRRDAVAAGVVCGSLLAFGLVLPLFGLLPATVVLVALTMIGSRERSWAEYIVLPLAFATAVTILFGLVLNLPVPILSAGGR